MADSSKETVEGVEPQLKEMLANLEKIIATIQHNYSGSQEQSAMLDEFHASFEQIVKTASQLSDQAYSRYINDGSSWNRIFCKPIFSLFRKLFINISLSYPIRLIDICF